MPRRLAPPRLPPRFLPLAALTLLLGLRPAVVLAQCAT